MPKEIPTLFQMWEFSDEERLYAQTFTELQEKHIRTELAICAHKRATVQEDPEKDSKVAFAELAYYRGAIEALSALLTTSDNVKAEASQARQAELDLNRQLEGTL